MIKGKKTKKKTAKTKIPATCGKDSIRRKFGYDGFAFMMEPFPLRINVVLVAPKQPHGIVKDLNKFYRLSPSFRAVIPKKQWDEVCIDERAEITAYTKYIPEIGVMLLVFNYRHADLGTIMHECDHIMTYMAEYGMIDKKSSGNAEFWAYTYTALVTRIYNRIRELGIRLVTY